MVGGHRLAFKILYYTFIAQTLGNSNLLGYSRVKKVELMKPWAKLTYKRPF